MSLIFRPNGSLDVATEPHDLPQTSGAPGQILSEALARCKNLSLERKGRVSTRYGTVAYNTNPLSSPANLIVEQAGVRYAFTGAEIYRNEVQIAAGLTAAQWSATKYNQFNDTESQIFALNGTDRKRISDSTVYEWGIAAPTTASVLDVGASTGLTGSYNAKYTYARKVGAVVVSESNPSAAQTLPQALSNQSLEVTVASSSDPQVTHVRLYRTLANGEIYYHDQDVLVGTTVIDTNTADTSLGSAVEEDHNRPPTGELIAGPFYGGICFIADGNLLYYCKSKQPEYWPTANFIEIGAPQFAIQAIFDWSSGVFCATRERLWQIQGNITGAFNALPLKSLAGAPNIFGAVGIEGRGIYHVGDDGIYLYRGGLDSNITQSEFAPIFRNETTAGIPGYSDSATSWLIVYENKLYFHWGLGNVLVFNLDTERVNYHKYDERLYAPAIDRTNGRFLVADTKGLVLRIEDSDASDDNGAAIDWELESAHMTLPTRRHFPRWLKTDVDASSATTATAKLVYDGTVFQSYTLSANRETKRRLVNEGNCRRFAYRFTGTGAVTIYGAESE